MTTWTRAVPASVTTQAGRLHEVSAAGATTRFLYDGADVIAEYNAAGTVLRRYVHGPGTDEPLVWYEGSGTSDRRYLLSDERGSIIGVTDGSGTVTQVNKYDAFGVPNPANQGRFQYTGQLWLAEVGLYHYKARIYHPKLGRFMQTDPIGTAGGMNL
jgi:RHS repeat-associated protein